MSRRRRLGNIFDDDDDDTFHFNFTSRSTSYMRDLRRRLITVYGINVISGLIGDLQDSFVTTTTVPQAHPSEYSRLQEFEKSKLKAIQSPEISSSTSSSSWMYFKFINKKCETKQWNRNFINKSVKRNNENVVHFIFHLKT